MKKQLYRMTAKLYYTLDGILDEKYYLEKNRLETFRSWPLWSPVPPSLLAREGFVYNSFYSDRVFCVFCKTCFQGFEPKQRPNTLHRKQAPQCSMVLGCETKNVPMDDDLLLQRQYEFLASTRPAWYDAHVSQHGRIKTFYINNSSQCTSPDTESQHQDRTLQKDNEKLCKICWHNQQYITFCPCGHGICIKCFKYHQNLTFCCICRTKTYCTKIFSK